MKRLHVHVSVENLAESIRFYSTMFSTAPTVAKLDYAKWMLDDPRVNFAISQRGAAIGLNHLGVQVESADELAEMHQRLEQLQGDVPLEADTACCYATSDKYWVTDPQGIAWETFHTLGNIPVFGDDQEGQATKAACCIPLAKTDEKNAAPCCIPAEKSKSASGTCC
jgi:hypothetical protein